MLIEDLKNCRFHSLTYDNSNKLLKPWNCGTFYIKDPVECLANGETLQILSKFTNISDIRSNIADIHGNIENLVFLALYLRNCDDHDLLKALETNSKNPNLWKSFKQKDLRLQHSKFSNYGWTVPIQEELERIRMQYLRERGFFDLKHIQNDQLLQKEASNLLGYTYSTIVDWAYICPEIAVQNLSLLAIYSGSLGLSWFQFDLLEIIRQYISKSYSNSNLFKDLLSLLERHAALAALDRIGVSDELQKVREAQNVNVEVSSQCLFLIIAYWLNGSSNIVPKSIAEGFSLPLMLGSRGTQLIAMLFTRCSRVQLSNLLKSFLHAQISYSENLDILQLTKIFYFVGESMLAKDFKKYIEQSMLESAKYAILGRDDTNIGYLLSCLAKLEKAGSFEFSYLCLGLLRALVDSKLPLTTTPHIQKLESIMLHSLQNLQIDIRFPLLFGELAHISKTPFASYTDIKFTNILELCYGSLCYAPGPYFNPIPAYFSCMNELASTEDLKKFTLLLDSNEFKSIGKICMGLSNIIEVLARNGEFESIQKLFTSILESSDSLRNSISSSFCVMLTNSKPSNEADQLQSCWKYLKTIFLASIIICEGFAKFLNTMYRQNPENTLVIRTLSITLLDIFHKFGFIRCRFGLGGIRLIDSIEKLIGNKFKDPASLMEYISGLALISGNDNVSEYLILADDLFKYNLIKLWFNRLPTNFILKQMESQYAKLFLGSILIQDSVPFPVKLKSDTKILAHAIYLQIFDSSICFQPFVRANCLNHVEQLLLNANSTLELDLVKESVCTIIRGLCDFSPSRELKILGNRFRDAGEAKCSIDENNNNKDEERSFRISDRDGWRDEALELAWQVIEIILLDINEPRRLIPSIPSKTAVDDWNSKYFTRLQLLSLLFDQISTIGLSRLDHLLQIIEGLILKCDEFGMETNDLQLWKRLFDAISGEYIDYSRRHHIVLWFIELKQKCEKLVANNVKTNARL